MLWTILWIVVGILVFMFLVMIHELGHFVAAKKAGVKVHEFGIGIPPKLFTLWKDKSGTEYTFNLIPLGWFVRLGWEDPSDPETFTAKDSLMQASLIRKVVILLWWIVVNFVFAFVTFAILFMVGIKPLTITPENATNMRSHSYLMPTMSFLIEKDYISREDFAFPAQVDFVIDDTIASSLGIMSWDIITKVDWVAVDTLSVMTALQSAIGKDVSLETLRWDIKNNLTLSCPDTECLLWVAFKWSSQARELPIIQFWFFESFYRSLEEIWTQSRFMLSTLWTLWTAIISFEWTEVKTTVDKFTWPVGAVKIWEIMFMSWGVLAYLAFAAMISLALAVFNLLPIPALDGWRLVWVLIQTIFNIKKEKYFLIEWYINAFFFILLMIMWIYILFKDLNVAWWIHIF